MDQFILKLRMVQGKFFCRRIAAEIDIKGVIFEGARQVLRKGRGFLPVEIGSLFIPNQFPFGYDH